MYSRQGVRQPWCLHTHGESDNLSHHRRQFLQARSTNQLWAFIHATASVRHLRKIPHLHTQAVPAGEVEPGRLRLLALVKCPNMQGRFDLTRGPEDVVPMPAFMQGRKAPLTVNRASRLFDDIRTNATACTSYSYRSSHLPNSFCGLAA